MFSKEKLFAKSDVHVYPSLRTDVTFLGKKMSANQNAER